MKLRVLSAILTFIMAVTCLAGVASIGVSAVSETTESTYVVAGNDPDVFGLIWYKYPTENNTMTKDGHIYTFTLNDVEPNNDLRFHIVENKANGTQYEYGYSYSIYEDPYIVFRVVSTTDVTITFDPETKEIDVFGDGVKLVTGVSRVYAISQNSDALGGRYPDNPYPDEGEMTLGEDGIYSVTFKDVAPEEDIKIDVIDEWIYNIGILGFYGFNYYPIDVVETCDVTVYYQPNDPLESSKIWAEGDGVVARSKPLIENLYVNFGDFKFNDSNKMTQVDDYLYQLKIENMVSSNTYSIQFWNKQTDYTDIWGGYFSGGPVELGVEHDTVMYPYNYSWSSMDFEVPYEHANVTITLDLTNFDYITKQGAKFRVDATDMRGDLNGDGKATIQDATELQKSLAGLVQLTENQNISADVNGDGKISIIDATEIQKYLSGFYNSFDEIADAE